MLVIPKDWERRWKGKDAFEQIFALDGTVRKEKRDHKILRVSLEGKNYYVKLHQGVGWREIIGNLARFRLPVLGAENEWRAIRRLHEVGIETMRLAGYGKRGWNPARRRSFVITEELGQTISLEDFCRDWKTSPPPYALKRALITKVAQVARTLHEHGINHRDLYLCHFLLDTSAGQESISSDSISLYLIDLHRVQIRRKVPKRWRIKDIASLYFSSMEIGLSRRDLLRFVRVYEEKPLREALKGNRIFWWRVKRRGASLYKKGLRKQLVQGEGGSCPICNSPGRFSFRGRDRLYGKARIFQYMRCDHCGAIYQNPMPSAKEISSFYPKEYPAHMEIEGQKTYGHVKRSVLRNRYGYSNLYVPPLFRLMAPFLALFICRDAIPYLPDGRALDIGCGNGRFILTMNALGWQFEGVEISKAAVDVCRRAGIKVFHGDLKSAAYPGESFDLVSARHLIEHVPEPGELMKEIFRILKRGGRLVVRTPNNGALGRRFFGTYWYANDVPRHLILFAPRSLDLVARQCGLRPVVCKTFTTPKIFLNSWDYFIGNRGMPSKKSKPKRAIARLYVSLAAAARLGDEIFAIYEKP